MRFFIYVLFCLSGAVALVYESLWSRYLKLFLGHSSYGQIVTLITFMGGIGLGSFLAARYLKRIRNPFRAYARIEFLAALCGFGFHAAYQFLTTSYFENATAFHGIPWAGKVVQVFICLLLTLPFATLLGTTFPLLAAGMIRAFSDGGRKSLPLLYFTNSLGGAAGILVTSYFLVSRFGTEGSLLIAALGNAAVAIGFFISSRQCESKAVISPDAPKSHPAKISLSEKSHVRLWLFIAAGTGFASFIYEIGWIRLLSLVMGSSTHSFDAMISAFILGLAFGGLFAKFLIARFASRLTVVLAIIQVAMGIAAVLSIYLYRPFFDAIGASHRIFTHSEAAYPVYSIFKYLLALAMMFPAAFWAGMTLPIITWRLIHRTGSEKFTGWVYGWNTIGSIFGAAIGGFILMPLLQLKWTIFAGAALDISLGVLLLCVVPFASEKKIRPLLLRATAIAIAAAALVPAFLTSFDDKLITSGRFRDLKGDDRTRRIVEARHGRTATICVGEWGDFIYLSTNGKSDGAVWKVLPKTPGKVKGDEGTVSELAVLPMLTRSGEYNAAVIGMGTGMTIHYLLGDERLQSADLIEIEEAVIDLAQHFRPRNERVWTDPRLNIIIDDAKSYFYANRKQYDLIISEPSNPWVSGVASLFTREFYHHTRQFLKPGGVLVQWVHGYEFNDDLMVSILAALREFPHFEIYRVPNNFGDFVILASESPIRFQPAEVLAENSNLTEELRWVGLTIDALGPSNFIASSKTLEPILAEASHTANSDYAPFVEQNSERAFFAKSRVNLFGSLMFGFRGYREFYEPERSWEGSPVEDRSTDYRLARDLLSGSTREKDWVQAERSLLEATRPLAGTSAWLEDPVVGKFRDAVEAGIVSEPVADRFRLLEAIAGGNDDKIPDLLSKAMASDDETFLREPFWIRTLAAQSARMNDQKSLGKVVVRGVASNPKISKHERILINDLVDNVIGLEGRGPARDRDSSE